MPLAAASAEHLPFVRAPLSEYGSFPPIALASLSSSARGAVAFSIAERWPNPHGDTLRRACPFVRKRPLGAEADQERPRLEHGAPRHLNVVEHLISAKS